MRTTHRKYCISLVKRRGYYESRDRYDAASIRGRRLLEGGVYPMSAFRRVVKMADGVYEYTIDCVIRGYHVYKATWVPSIGDILQCEQERGNVEDMFAVAVKSFFSPFVASTLVPAFHLPQTFCQPLGWKSSNYILLKSYVYRSFSFETTPLQPYTQLVVLINAAATIGGRRLFI